MEEILVMMLAVFLMAATPLLEVWIAIPAGIAMGLDPVLTALMAGLGNFIPLIFIAIGFERFRLWFESRCKDREERVGFKRFKRLWELYGLPVAALAAPATIGTHLALLMIMSLGADARRSLLWMGLSIGLWTLIVTPLAVIGVDMFIR